MTAFTYTFGDQLDKLSELLGDPNTSTDDAFPLARRKFLVNMGEVQFARDSKLLLGYATGTVSGSTITLPSDWVETFVLIVNNVVISNDKEIALQDWERYYADSETSPYFYYWVAADGTRQINLIGSSAAGQTYKIFYFRKPTTALADTSADTSPFPLEYREASVYWAAGELLEQIGKTQLADRYRNKYAQYVAKGNLESERLYINKEYPRPDLGDPNTPTQPDRQGHGYFE